MTSGERALLDFAAARQHGIFTRQLALRYGMSDNEIDRRLASGRWARVQPRTYRTAGTPLTRMARLLAAIAAIDDCERQVAVSHSSAAELHGIARSVRPEVIEVSVTGQGLPLLWDVQVHRTSGLTACDMARVGCIPVTSGARTVIDLVQHVDRAEALAIADEAVGARATSADWLYRRADALANGRRNVGYLSRVIGPDGHGEFRSWLERHGAGVFRNGGLPRPRWNAEIRDGARLVGVADTLWDPVPLIAQLDGPQFHDGPQGRDKDRRQDRDYASAGYLVLRVGYWELVHSPDAVVRDIRAALVRLRHPAVRP